VPTRRKVSREAVPEGEATAAPVSPPATQVGSLTPAALREHLGRRWYAVHTYSGYENKVKTQLEKRAANMHLADRIFQVLVPTEEVAEVHDGERRTVTRKVFPSYVLVDMQLDDETWHCVRQTPGVTGFIGGNDPLPLEEHEVEAILRQTKKTEEGQAPVVMPRFSVGQAVRVIDGPFAEFVGQISEIHPERNKLTVLISAFNRETPLELDFLQVEKV
jgi:transcriptional antiterminator NusG